MPIHDWMRVSAGTFHHFHQTWVVEISRVLNAGLLPEGFYAMAEQIAGGWGPDVLTLEGPEDSAGTEAERRGWQSTGASAIAVEERPPRVAYHAKAEVDRYTDKASVIAIRHSTNHRVVAMIEIVSPGNKNKAYSFTRFVDKALDVLDAGVALLVVDLFPPGPFDPHGMHAAIWQNYDHEAFEPPAKKPLTLASYVRVEALEAYVEPTAVGAALIDMPLFLDPGRYVPVPLEKTYLSAWEAVPAIWQRVLEGPAINQ